MEKLGAEAAATTMADGASCTAATKEQEDTTTGAETVNTSDAAVGSWKKTNQPDEDRKMPAQKKENEKQQQATMLSGENEKMPPPGKKQRSKETTFLPNISQPDILEHILGYAIPYYNPDKTEAERKTAKSGGTSAAAVSKMTKEDLRLLEGARSDFSPTAVKKQSISWLPRMRGVNHLWKTVIDDPSSNLWFLVAEAHQLDPPRQLFCGGTHEQVCKILLDYEEQVAQESKDILRQRQSAWGRTGCMQMRPEPKGLHPNPRGHQIKLPMTVSSRISATAQALEEFLRSINFTHLSKRSGRAHGNEKSDDTDSGDSDDSDFGDSWHEKSLIRYRMFLYLKKKYPKAWIIPTADIEFCWLAHIFRTKIYWADMSRLGINPNHFLQLNKGETAIFLQSVEGTEKLWRSEFGCEYIPNTFSATDWAKSSREHNKRDQLYAQKPVDPCFRPYAFLPVTAWYSADTSGGTVVEGQLPTVSLTSAEVKADLEWFPQLQAGLREIARNRYDVLNGSGNKVELYQKHLIPSYERFLNLCFDEKIQNADPPYVLDLIWHAHQADPVAYKNDCKSLFGGELWHEPWPNGLGLSTDVSTSLECAWKEAYGTTLEEDWQLQPGP